MVIHISEAQQIDADSVGNRDTRRQKVAQHYRQKHGVELDLSDSAQVRSAWREYELERQCMNSSNRAQENERRERAYAKLLEQEQQQKRVPPGPPPGPPPAQTTEPTQIKKAKTTRYGYGTPSVAGGSSSSAGPSHGQL